MSLAKQRRKGASDMVRIDFYISTGKMVTRFSNGEGLQGESHGKRPYVFLRDAMGGLGATGEHVKKIEIYTYSEGR